jgi:hypothetical protein
MINSPLHLSIHVHTTSLYIRVWLRPIGTVPYSTTKVNTFFGFLIFFRPGAAAFGKG